MNKKSLASPAILLVFTILVGLYHFFGYTGHFGFDDLHYAELASGLLKGHLDFEDHYAYRFTVIAFTSLSYWIYGISDFSSSLPALLITFTILLIVFNILRHHGPAATIIGLSLCCFSNWFLFYTDKLMPDIYVALSVLLALAIINRYKYRSTKKRTFVYAFLLACALLFGFLSKGTIVLILPLLIYLIITDVLMKRDVKFWIYSVISGLSLLALYLLIIWLLTGDLMKRFDAIAHNSYLNPCSYDQQPLGVLLKRIFGGFFSLTIFQSLASGFIFVFAHLFQRKGLRFFRLDDSFSFFLTSAVILFLSSNFMSISPTAYAPMCLDPRHYLFLIPVVAIPASRIIGDFFTHKKTATQILIALFSITLISYFLEGSAFWRLYLPLFVLFTIYHFAHIKKLYQHLFIILFAVVLLLIPISMIGHAQQVKYRKQRKLITEQVMEKHKDYIVVSDQVQKRLLEYYTGFNADRAHRFLSFDEFEADTAIDGKKLMLLNGHTRYLSFMSDNDLPFYARNISASNKLLFEDKELAISLYEMHSFPMPGESITPLLETYNDFEETTPHWNQSDQDISSNISFSGSRANRVSRYSSTFEYPLDSLQKDALDKLLVQCRLHCYSESETKAKMIVSIESNEGNSFWKALEIDSYMKAYGNWWPVSFEVVIPHKNLLRSSRLKVYVWNKEMQSMYIDDFRVSLTAIPASDSTQ